MIKLLPTLQTIVFTLILCTISACDFPTHYFTPAPDCSASDALKMDAPIDLADQLADKTPADFRYFFQTFEEVGEQVFMHTNFRSETQCFDVKILVDKWDKLAGMRRTNGYSYPNELYDLEWKLLSDEGTTLVKYVDMHRIID